MDGLLTLPRALVFSQHGGVLGIRTATAGKLSIAEELGQLATPVPAAISASMSTSW